MEWEGIRNINHFSSQSYRRFFCAWYDNLDLKKSSTAMVRRSELKQCLICHSRIKPLVLHSHCNGLANNTTTQTFSSYQWVKLLGDFLGSGPE